MADIAYAVEAEARPEPAPSPRLAPLREDLHLHEGPRAKDGSPTWTLEDPSRGKFFRIGWSEVEMLARWDMAKPDTIAAAIAKTTTLEIGEEDVKAFAHFLGNANLLQVFGTDANARLARQARSTRTTGWHWLLKNYLFVRVPLVRPDKFLSATLPYVQPLYTRAFFHATLAVALAGLYLVARQWEVFRTTFLHFFSFEGAALAGATLIFAKIFHELGHAYTAKRYGCRISTMGVALLVMWPVLYTDTSGAWTLKDRKQRLAIGAAGVAAELTIAAYATLLWSFLPDGMLRSAVFMLATTTWILTVIININPFMRYDGYFLASDLLDVPNLQERAFQLARWRLREWLFDFGEPKPDAFDPETETILIAYGFGTWIYRFFLFLGIALLVYHFFFKALGIALFLVEIGYFIIRPIAAELREWVQRRQKHRLNARTILTLAGFGLIALAVLVPWRTTIDAPALLHAEQEANLFAPSPARLDAILAKPGDAVKAGQVLYRFASPDLEHQLADVQWQIQVLRWQDVFQAQDQQTVSDTLIVRQQLQAALAREAALQVEKTKLAVNAPFDGVLVDQADPMAVGEWMPDGELLGTVIVPRTFEVESFVAESDVSRLKPGARARFFSEDPGRAAVDLVVSEMDQTATRTLAGVPELASVHGGGIASVGQRDAVPVPEGAVYRVLLKPEKPQAPGNLALRGTVSIRGNGQSLLLRAWTAVAAILVRETGF